MSKFIPHFLYSFILESKKVKKITPAIYLTQVGEQDELNLLTQLSHEFIYSLFYFGIFFLLAGVWKLYLKR